MIHTGRPMIDVDLKSPPERLILSGIHKDLFMPVPKVQDLVPGIGEFDALGSGRGSLPNKA